MKQIILPLLCSVLLASCIPNTPNSILTSRLNHDLFDPKPVMPVNLAEYEKNYGKYDGVFLNYEQIIEKTGGLFNMQAIRISKLKYLVLNPDAQWLTTFNLRQDKTAAIHNVHIRITSPDGKEQIYGVKDLKVEAASDESKAYKFVYPDIQKGSIVEEAFQIDYDRPGSAPDDVMLQYDVPCEHLSFSYAYPDWWEVQFKEITPGVTVPHRIIHDSASNKTIVTYRADSIPALAEEAYDPFVKENTPYMKFKIARMKVRGYVDYADTWKDLSSSFQRYAIDKQSFWSGRLGTTVSDLIENKSTAMEKLDTIVTFVQQNIKITQGEPEDDFADVLRKHGGNWYLVTGLTRAMLAEAGIESDFLLIHSAKDGYFDRSYVDDDEIYIPAILTKLDDREYVVFPYIRNYPIDQIPDYYQGQDAIKIHGDGFYGFTTLPVIKAGSNTVQENYDLMIDGEGNISIQEEKTIVGAGAYEMREALSLLKKSEMEKAMKELLTYSDGDVKLDNYEITNLNDYKKSLIIKLRYTIDNLVTVTPDEVVFQTGGLFSPSSNRKTKVDNDERQNPIRIYLDERYVKNISVHYPPSWNLTSPLKDIEEENDFGSINAKYSIASGELNVRQERALKKTSQPREKADELLAMTGRKSRLYLPALIFKVGE